MISLSSISSQSYIVYSPRHFRSARCKSCYIEYLRSVVKFEELTDNFLRLFERIG